MKEMIYLPVDKLHQHPNNPREDLGDLTELADSIKANGIMQNLIVVPLANTDPDATISLGDGHYTVIIGHRRLAAAKLAGLAEVPCVIAEMDEREQIQTMLMENIQRSDLTVYEQAQGFQMMLNLGVTVDEIAQKTGFSTATVRRRVKMTELDQAKLKEVSSRQISLGDFDQLAKIENIKERNKVLESIGTAEFQLQYRQAMRRQMIKKNMPAVKAFLSQIGAKKLPQNEQVNKYEKYPGTPYYIGIEKWSEEVNKLPKTWKHDAFYNMYSDSFTLYKKKDKVKPAKKSPKELAKIIAVNKAWKSLMDTANLAYELRKQFAEELVMTAQNSIGILTGALYGAMMDDIYYYSPSRDIIGKIFDIDFRVYDPDRGKKILTGIEKLDKKDIPLLCYATFGDDAKDLCTEPGTKSDFPQFKPSVKLMLLYKWLTSLGYQISYEEDQLLNGTLDAYHAKEKFEEGNAAYTEEREDLD